MADKIELEIEITADGKVVVKTHGLKGKTCVDETEDLEKAVGKLLKREKTREAYEQARVVSKTTVKK